MSGRAGRPALVGLLLATALATPALFWKGGVLEEETIVFLRNYWSDRSLAQEVLDPHANDFGTYQARELSYLVDWSDAQVLSVLLQGGLDFLVPASALLASGLIVLVFVRGCRSVFPGVDLVTAALVLPVYLTNFVFVSTMGVFYRATKPLLAPALLAFLFLLLRLLREERPPRWPDYGALFGLGAAMSLLDRQGFYYTAVAVAAVGVVVVWRRRGRSVLWALLAATAFGLLYNYVLGPRLVHLINGYWPAFRYQRLALRKLADPRFYGQAGELLFTYAGTLLGGLPGLAVCALVVVGAVVGLRSWRRQGRPLPILGLLLVSLVAGSQVVMFALMIMRYPQVHDWADHRLWYYPLPFQILVIFLILVILNAVLPLLPSAGRAALRLVLLAATVANVAAWKEDRATMAAGPWFSRTYTQSTLFRASLRQGRAEDLLWGAYRDFYHECVSRSPALRARALPDARGGPGFYPTEPFEGRVLAWARQQASLILDVRVGGVYRVLGELWLRPGERVELLAPGAEPAAVWRADAGEGPAPFSLLLTLPAGATALPLRAEQAEREVGPLRERKAAAFGLFFPVTLAPAAGYDSEHHERE